MFGETARARRAMARLLEGKPLRMSTIGGSITKCALPARLLPPACRRRLSASCAPSAGAAYCKPPSLATWYRRGHNADRWGETDYSSRVFSFVRKGFPGAEHELLNGAAGATQSTCAPSIDPRAC